MYNCKVKDFGNGQVQTRLYSHVVHTGKRKSYEKVEKEFEENPFDGELVPVVLDLEQHIKDKERSVMVSLKRAKAKIYDYARANEWDWFVTLTFDSNKVNRYDYDLCVKKVSKWLKNMQMLCSNHFRYLVVAELHQDGAYHFHGLFADCSELEFADSGHKDRKGRTIYNIGKYNFGFTTATQVGIQEAVSKYVTKYITKEYIEANKGRKKYWNSRNLNLPTETNLLLEGQEKTVLKTELLEELEYFKSVNYQVLNSNRQVRYYEHVERVEE